ncbi:MAG: DUF3540 domain-containing protein [Deltaproteobacteria bacterium]|jgi:hypothetical protein|nr:DUF3540 domain-containing protein [Deltaproteobacteria bacterium]MBW2536001.1 DUF3540 domain-containing protein [Deltaproteobacteria bacterium]
MTAVAKLMESQPELATGRIRLAESRAFTVSLEGARGGEITAAQAASCLLAPCPGDRVLVALLPEPYVLAVLDREGSREAQVRFDGSARIDAAGELDLGAARGIRLRTPRVLALMAGKLRTEARVSELVTERLTAFGKAAQAHFDEMGIAARTCDWVADRVASRIKRAYRTVEEYEQLRARHIDYRAEQTAQLKGETTVVTARQVVKVDGSQVHIG